MNNYRYCFFCDKWLSKKEIKEINLGGGNKTFNCPTCRKDLGNQIQIFKCPNHPQTILKVWGTCEGQNKEKIFFKECPRDKQQEKQPEQKGKRAFWFIGGGIVLVGGLFLLGWYFWKGGRYE